MAMTDAPTDGAPAVERVSAGRLAHGYMVSVLSGEDAVLSEVARLIGRGTAVATPFQTEPWLRAHITGPARAVAGEARLVVARDGTTGKLAAALPLLVRRAGGLLVADIPDLGVSDYCAPLLGEAAPGQREAAGGLAKALLAGLDGIDRVVIEKMPAEVGGRTNPLAAHPSSLASKFNANRLTIECSVEAFLASRGKKYRKEAERSWRRLEDAGKAEVRRLTDPAEIVRAYAVLESWQQQRHRDAGHDYWLDRPEISAFYRDLLLGGGEQRLASLYTLTAGEHLVAVLFGVTHDATFTLLRIADAAGEWSHCSPGRMIVLGVMRATVAEGVTTFDMGIGDYPFKRWIGCTPHPLFDLDVALSAKAMPVVALANLKRGLRQNPRAIAFLRRVKAFGRTPQGNDTVE